MQNIFPDKICLCKGHSKSPQKNQIKKEVYFGAKFFETHT